MPRDSPSSLHVSFRLKLRHDNTISHKAHLVAEEFLQRREAWTVTKPGHPQKSSLCLACFSGSLCSSIGASTRLTIVLHFSTARARTARSSATSIFLATVLYNSSLNVKAVPYQTPSATAAANTHTGKLNAKNVAGERCHETSPWDGTPQH